MAENNNLIDGTVDSIRKVFLAGVGAVATGAEKTTELIEEFVKKGELTVAQGKDLNAELTQKAKEAASEAKKAAGSVEESALKARLSLMNTEERAAYLKRAAELSAELEAEAAEKAAKDAVEVESEVIDEPKSKKDEK